MANDEPIIARRYDEINALRARVNKDATHPGWLSTLTWNVCNELAAWPDDKVLSQKVDWLIEGFLDEVAALRLAIEVRDVVIRSILVEVAYMVEANDGITITDDVPNWRIAEMIGLTTLHPEARP